RVFPSNTGTSVVILIARAGPLQYTSRSLSAPHGANSPIVTRGCHAHRAHSFHCQARRRRPQSDRRCLSPIRTGGLASGGGAHDATVAGGGGGFLRRAPRAPVL